MFHIVLFYTEYKVSESFSNSYQSEVFFFEVRSIKCEWLGRFHSWYSAKCGNDCFTDSYGTYEKVNVFYIRFHLSKITNSCDVRTQKKKETSLYYIHKVSEREIYLIKSTGDLIKDQQKAVNSKQ